MREGKEVNMDTTGWGEGMPENWQVVTEGSKPEARLARIWRILTGRTR
jgi:hypothetical protein